MSDQRRPPLRIDAHDPRDRTRIGVTRVDPASRPTRIRFGGEASPRDVFLEWEGTLDDSGRLRRCPICGCGSLYRTRSLPAVTPYVLVVAFAGIGLSLLGYDDPRLLAVLTLLLAIDVGLLVFARTHLVCYRCGSRYDGLPIARQHRAWDRSEQQRQLEPRPETPVEGP